LKEAIEDIIKGCADGKLEAQRKLYDEFSGKMYGLCLQYSKNSEEAKDILQEGFIKVFKSIGQFSFSGSFSGWIRRVFVNTAIENFRNKKMKFSDVELQNIPEYYSFDNVIEDISAKEILKLVQELSPRYRLVFNLYAIEGYTHKEIAEKLNISDGTSKSNLARARVILQKRVKELMQD
jgi:RNA polymerase sigma-70 factor (ECF subfamily)